MSYPPNITTGEAPFAISRNGQQLPTKTWYKIFGDLSARSATCIPLILLHGGPGTGHEYLAPIALATSSCGIPTILYDQVGTGQSTHLPSTKGDTTFWTVDLYLEELDNLLNHLGIADKYNILGHSWGGMLAAEHAIQRQNSGLTRLILSDTLADMHSWIDAMWKLRATLPEETQATLKEYEDAGQGSLSDESYQAASAVFMFNCMCTVNPPPPEFLTTMAWIAKDPTVSSTMYGTSQWTCSGTLKDWSILETIHKISVPTLLISAGDDNPLSELVWPMFTKIKTVKWVTFSHSTHSPHLEEPDKYMKVVKAFLQH